MTDFLTEELTRELKTRADEIYELLIDCWSSMTFLFDNVPKGKQYTVNRTFCSLDWTGERLQVRVHLPDLQLMFERIPTDTLPILLDTVLRQYQGNVEKLRLTSDVNPLNLGLHVKTDETEPDPDAINWSAFLVSYPLSTGVSDECVKEHLRWMAYDIVLVEHILLVIFQPQILAARDAITVSGSC